LDMESTVVSLETMNGQWAIRWLQGWVADQHFWLACYPIRTTLWIRSKREGDEKEERERIAPESGKLQTNTRAHATRTSMAWKTPFPRSRMPVSVEFSTKLFVCLALEQSDVPESLVSICALR
jgi:hypothetical protein